MSKLPSPATRCASAKRSCRSVVSRAAKYQRPSSQRRTIDSQRQRPSRVPMRHSRETSALPFLDRAPTTTWRSSAWTRSTILLPARSSGCHPSVRSQAPVRWMKRRSESALASSTGLLLAMPSASDRTGRVSCTCFLSANEGPTFTSAGALLARSEQAFSELALVLGGRIERGRVREGVEAGEAEQLLEQLGRAVERGAEARAAGLVDESALEQRADGRLRGDAADACDLGPGDGLQIGDDRQALGLGLGESRGARPRQQAAGGPLRDRVGGEREAARDLAQHHPAVALGVVLAQPGERLDDLALGHLGGVGQALDRDRLRREEEERLDGSRQIIHEFGTTVMGPNGTSCSHFASPAL